MLGFAQAVLNGILLGGVYALVSVGLTLIFGVMKIVNFAHGEFLMLGMFASYELVHRAGVHPYVALPLVAAALMLVGMVVERFLVARTVGGPDEPSILLTVGLSAFLQGAALAVWGPDYHSMGSPLEWQGWSLFGLYVPIARLVAFGVSLALSLGVYLLLTRTDMGKAIRAAAESLDVSMLLGIDPRRVYLLAFGIGIALVGVAGGLLSPIMYSFPTVGQLFVLTAFVVVVLGGLGDVRGAVVGGIVIGIVESLSGTYIAFDLSKVATFVIFVALLLWRPQGLFGRAWR